VEAEINRKQVSKRETLLQHLQITTVYDFIIETTFLIIPWLGISVFSKCNAL